MAKARPQIDVMVLGSHPACYFAAALLKLAGTNVLQATIPGEADNDRLVHINPEFWNLHKLLGAIHKQLEMTAVYGLRFLADDPAVQSETVAKNPVAFVGSLKQIRGAMRDAARQAKVELIETRSVEILRIDESGVEVAINSGRFKPRLLIVGGLLPAPHRRVLGIQQSPEAELPRCYTFLRLKGAKWIEPSARPIIPMSLDLRGKLQWGWLLPFAKEIQLAVEQPAETVPHDPPPGLLKHWIDVLVTHKTLRADPVSIDLAAAQSIELPLAHALSQESVANRTLLIGPAGGFYTACAEDIYPNCWSAIFAAEVARKALAERHIQDALGPYRQRWGATLGDYLRGPQQNLRFLLPLVYRNPVMTARMMEAILSGASVVR